MIIRFKADTELPFCSPIGIAALRAQFLIDNIRHTIWQTQSMSNILKEGKNDAPTFGITHKFG